MRGREGRGKGEGLGEREGGEWRMRRLQITRPCKLPRVVSGIKLTFAPPRTYHLESPFEFLLQIATEQEVQ